MSESRCDFRFRYLGSISLGLGTVRPAPTYGILWVNFSPAAPLARELASLVRKLRANL